MKSIIKKVKTICYHVKSWTVALFMMVFMIWMATRPWAGIGKIANEVAENWNEGNLLYLPDLLRLLLSVAELIILPITVIVCIITTILTIGIIIYKLYAYFIKKDKNALWDLLDVLVYHNI